MNEKAFPITKDNLPSGHGESEGMDLIDWFAGKALQGYVGSAELQKMAYLDKTTGETVEGIMQKPNTNFRKTVDKRTVRIFTEKGRKFKVANIACIDPCKILK